MTFEEFFKKKKINLSLLQQAEPALFAEFEDHYSAMGEKSFDHTKKYWFNKLRRLYVLPPEPKVEKVIIENQIAEQTIVESLTEPVVEKPKVGFTPRFKAPVNTPKPTGETPITEPAKAAETSEPDKPKVGFTPRFKAGVTAAKPVEETLPEKIEQEPKPEEPAKPKVGFTPRFKAGVTAAKPVEDALPGKIEQEPKAEEPTKPKVGFTPRFKPPQK